MGKGSFRASTEVRFTRVMEARVRFIFAMLCRCARPAPRPSSYIVFKVLPECRSEGAPVDFEADVYSRDVVLFSPHDIINHLVIYSRMASAFKRQVLLEVFQKVWESEIAVVSGSVRDRPSASGTNNH